jgi:hypothetical protein
MSRYFDKVSSVVSSSFLRVLRVSVVGSQCTYRSTAMSRYSDKLSSIMYSDYLHVPVAGSPCAYLSTAMSRYSDKFSSVVSLHSLRVLRVSVVGFPCA